MSGVIYALEGSQFAITGPAAVLVPLTLIIAMREGRRSGLLAAGFVAGFLYLLAAHSPEGVTSASRSRIALWLVSLPVSVLLVVHMNALLLN
ncbi:MAG: hypothetical protein EOP09_05295 [Proteobacteria bacterium]|nr:MAG: hypothetical protein EOP09_05295 [Pseudomonadota bacterium]